MKHISLKMKLLSLAVLGLGGMALAGTAAAACPTLAQLPWSSNTVTGSASLNVTATGLDGSACKLDAKVSGPGLGTSAYVEDDSPNAEPRYRAQFLIDTTQLTSFTPGQFFTAFTAFSGTFANNNNRLLWMTVTSRGIAGGAPVLSVSSACSAGTGLCSVGSQNLQVGVNRIEVEWVRGAGASDGVARVWVNNTTEATPSLQVTNLANAAWPGVDSVSLGLVGPTNGFMSGHANQTVSFDTFDSRRTTFIGNN